jgi:hypothetical protein
MVAELFEQQLADILAKFDGAKIRKSLLPRPFMIELFGTPKAGKSTIKEMLKHFFKRNGWAVSTPTEGAEVVELPRDEPQYNFQTAEYAMSFARERYYDKRFHVVIFDRAIYDGIARMQHYADRRIITPEQHAVIEGYYLLPWNRNMFDVNVCLVCEPEIAIKRELARVLTKKHGDTMNPATLAALREAHDRMWQRLDCANDPKMFWYDSSTEDEAQTAKAVLTAVCDAMSRRLAAESAA